MDQFQKTFFKKKISRYYRIYMLNKTNAKKPVMLIYNKNLAVNL